MNLVNRFERRLLRIRVEPFFRYIVFAMGGVYVLQWLFPSFLLVDRMRLVTARVFQGEVWRLLTFLAVPPLDDPLRAALSLYFYYFIGTALESRWGARRFLIYYAIGAVGALAAALLTGLGTNVYLNLSMFFAFALLNKDFQVLLFFVLPVKMKWLAAASALFFLFSFVRQGWVDRAAILLSFVNLFLFFGGDLLSTARVTLNQWRRRRAYRRSIRS